MTFWALLAASNVLSRPASPVQVSNAVPAALAASQRARKKILLVPLDSRPASGQFAQMIGAIASVDVITPPTHLLGRFTETADVRGIFEWLESRPMENVDAVIVSVDMIAYGGLIASRDNQVSESTALARVRRLIEFRSQAADNAKFYLFATTMRLTPTATTKAKPYRENLARYEEFKDRFERTKDRSLLPRMERLRKLIPAGEISKYETTRERNHQVQKSLLQLAKNGRIDYVIMGQDDAKPDGPQIQENARLKRITAENQLQGKVFFCEGIDQHSNILVSRAILSSAGFRPKVRVVYSDERGKSLYANYESKPIIESLSDQIFASGAALAKPFETPDYTLFLNTPQRREAEFAKFVEDLESSIDSGKPTAVSDINFQTNGISDEKLFESLSKQGRLMKLFAFAGWNTAGNTMGTTIPTANLVALAKKSNANPVEREIAQREFIFHRVIDDWAYHRYSRPSAYDFLQELNQEKDEVYGENFNRLDQFVRRDLEKHANRIFQEQFFSREFQAGENTYRIVGLDNLQISLPWPRAYEVRADFKFRVEKVK